MYHFEISIKALCFLVFAVLVALPKTVIAQPRREVASINRAALVLVKPSSLFGPSAQGLSPELVDAYNKTKSDEKPFDPSLMIPTGMQPTADSNRVFSQVADQSVSSFFSSAQVRSTPFGKTATTVEQKMKQDVTLHSGEIEHKFVLRVQAFQALAKIDYTGYTNATLRYQARESSVDLEVFEKITKTKDLVLGQLNKPNDRISSVQVRWNF